jgi:peptide/nickel transport system substrate-binding protein
MDADKRLALLREAQRIALVEDQGVIPLHFQVDLYAAKRSIRFTPRLDGQIRAFEITEESH